MPLISTDARQQQVRMMEGVLTIAVRNGAEGVARRLQMAEPGSLFVTGVARARGFALEGYGVFFDVDVPQMKQGSAWATMVLLREQQRQQLRQRLAETTDPATRQILQAQLRRLDTLGAPVASSPDAVAAAPSPVANALAPGTVSAQTVADPVALDPRDPNEQYTESIKTAIIEAMLNYSAPMGLRADEWLTVAARDDSGPVLPGAIADVSTIVFRVKGSDLLAFQAKQISLEDARKRVQVRDF
jgi:hypothetical protein